MRDELQKVHQCWLSKPRPPFARRDAHVGQDYRRVGRRHVSGSRIGVIVHDPRRRHVRCSSDDDDNDLHDGDGCARTSRNHGGCRVDDPSRLHAPTGGLEIDDVNGVAWRWPRYIRRACTWGARSLCVPCAHSTPTQHPHGTGRAPWLAFQEGGAWPAQLVSVYLSFAVDPAERLSPVTVHKLDNFDRPASASPDSAARCVVSAVVCVTGPR